MSHGDIKLVIDQLNNVREPLLECDYQTLENAVNTIETLANERDRLSTLCDKWNAECDEMRDDNKRLDVENARLRDALEQYKLLVAAFFHQYDCCIPHQGMMAEAIDELRMYDPEALKGQP